MEKKRLFRQLDKKLWTGIAAIVLSLLLICLCLSCGGSRQEMGKTVKVVAAAEQLKKGTRLTDQEWKESLVLLEIPQGQVPNGAVSDPEKLKGRIVAHTLEKNEILSAGDTVDETAVERQMNEPVELTFAASSPAASVGGKIRGGDIINVGIISRDRDGNARYEAVKDAIYVKDAMDDKGKNVKPMDRETVCTMFCVIMERRDAEYLIARLRDGDETVVTLPKME